MPRLNKPVINHIMGLLLVCNGAFMTAAGAVSYYYEDGVTLDIFIAAVITIISGLLLMYFTRGRRREVKKRDGYVIVSVGWLLMALSGTLPYILSDTIPSLANAFFETMSGYTTTGSTILNDIESMPEGILFWRSLTHWIGGMGIIVLAIAILPLLGIGGMQLFAAEAPGPSADKLKPRITDTAKRLWFIYVGLTFAQTVLLWVAGMNLFEAANHALSTLSTGGFSTRNASVAAWNDNPLVQYIIILFMFLAGINFIISYYMFKGNFRKVSRDEEFRWYGIFIFGFTMITALIVYFKADPSLSSIEHPMVLGEMESAFRHGMFQVVSVITTTGFVTADYTMWTPFLTVLFFGIFFLGGSAGSTSGGVKVMRHIIMIRNGITEFKRTLHPNAILPVHYNGKSISKKIVFNVLGFFILYMLSFIIGAVVLAFLGMDFETAIGGAASSLGNIGPGLGFLGPVNNYEAVPTAAKIWCAFLMLIGRLELFTVLILLTPFVWRNR